MNEAQTIASEKLAGSTDYFSVSELGEMLGLYAATIRLWIRERLPSVRKDGPTQRHNDQHHNRDRPKSDEHPSPGGKPARLGRVVVRRGGAGCRSHGGRGSGPLT